MYSSSSTEFGVSETSPLACFHCGEAVPPGENHTATISNKEEAMCCPGCAAVATAICDLGMEDYYLRRTATAKKAKALVPRELEKLALYDHPKVQESFTKEVGDQLLEMELILEGITCPACSWLCESSLKRLSGMVEADVNFTNHRASIRWDKQQLSLTSILKAIQDIGYQAHPYSSDNQKTVTERERKKQLRNLGITGVLGMQVMMISIALYFGKGNDMSSNVINIFHGINLALTSAVFFTAGLPFLKNALRDLRIFHASMDLAVSLGLSIAFAASIMNTLRGEGEVYFDTIVMFIFLISISRYFEFMHRQKSIEESHEQLLLLPAVATRINPENHEQETVVVADLQLGDHLLIKPGETIVADCLVNEGSSVVDESMLTGESMPVRKSIGDRIIAGSTNIDSPLKANVQQLGDNTVLASIRRLIDKAQSEKPKLSKISDQVASWFIMAVITIAFASIFYHGIGNVDAWLSPTIAILIVSCPCALSLATPSALTVSLARLLKEGIAVKEPYVLSQFQKLSHIIFDKTGTVTEGKIQLQHIEPLSELNETDCHRIAAALEAGSEHPIAKALRKDISIETKAKNFQNYPGKGISAIYQGQLYYLGKAHFINEMTGLGIESIANKIENNNSQILLANENTLLAVFQLSDQIRPGLKTLIHSIRKLGLHTLLLSGDQENITGSIAKDNQFNEWQGGLLPQDKLQRLTLLQKENGHVAMVGDGINDAPVLAKSDISIAMGNGTDIAKVNADIILLREELLLLPKLFELVRFTKKIIHQNISWAILYNLIALPIAVSGYLQPWMAAIGMSLSSLLVVFNANRIRYVSIS